MIYSFHNARPTAKDNNQGHTFLACTVARKEIGFSPVLTVMTSNIRGKRDVLSQSPVFSVSPRQWKTYANQE
jgi:hypothetical protein